MRHILALLCLASLLYSAEDTLVEKAVFRDPRGHHGNREHRDHHDKRGPRSRRGHRGKTNTCPTCCQYAYGILPFKTQTVNSLEKLQLRTTKITGIPTYTVSPEISTTDGSTIIDISPDGFGWYEGQLSLALSQLFANDKQTNGNLLIQHHIRFHSQTVNTSAPSRSQAERDTMHI